MSRRTAVGGLMIVAALSFLCASALHFGATISIPGGTIHDPFQGAAIPEMIIGIVMGLGSMIVLIRHRVSWAVALAAVSFALLGVIYGLTVTLREGRIGDISYHFSVLALLVITLVLLVVPKTRQELRPKT
jgi:hypothetical protein